MNETSRGAKTMKKWMIAFIVSLCLVVGLSGCSKEDDKGLVDKKMTTVDITIPKQLVEQGDFREKEEMKGVRYNDDGSVSFTVPRAKYEQSLKEMRHNIKEMLQEMSDGEDFPSIQEIKVNSAFDHYTIIVDREAYENSLESFSLLGIGYAALLEQAYAGKTEEALSVQLDVQDVSTNEVFHTLTIPQDWNEAETK